MVKLTDTPKTGHQGIVAAMLNKFPPAVDHLPRVSHRFWYLPFLVCIWEYCCLVWVLSQSSCSSMAQTWGHEWTQNIGNLQCKKQQVAQFSGGTWLWSELNHPSLIIIKVRPRVHVFCKSWKQWVTPQDTSRSSRRPTYFQVDPQQPPCPYYIVK